MATLMVGIVGFGADIGNWYWVGAKQQKAVDAAALAAVTQMPAPIAGTVTNIANSAMSKNGYANGGDTTVTVESIPGSPTQLRVRSETVVKTYFASVFGMRTVKVVKSARAEFRGSVSMGNPSAVFGNDPEGTNYPNHWLVASGPNEYKQNGDRYGANDCSAAAYYCSSTNAEKTDGVYFAIEVSPAAAARAEPLNVEVYDGIFAKSGDAVCSGGYPATGTLSAATLAGWGVPSADPTRYTAGSSATPNKWCTGEQVARTSTYLTTSFTVYNPMTQAYAPMSGGAACAQKDYGGVNIGTAGTLADYLNPTTTNGASALGAQFRASFHRWNTLCTITSKVAGTYILKVATSGGSGNNIFSLRVSTGVTNSGVRNETGMTIAAMDRFVIYANKPATGSAVTGSFYLARVPPGAAGSNLLLSLFDIGDSSGSITIQPIAPAEATGTGITTSGSIKQFGGGTTPCKFSLYKASDNLTVGSRVAAMFGSLNYQTSNTCTFSGLTSSAGYQGGLVEMELPIPANYTCDWASATGCWVRLNMTFPAGTSPTDVTSWEAVLQKKLVRLMSDT